MGVSRLFRRLALPGDGARVSPNRNPVERPQGEPFWGHHRQLPLVEDEDLSRLPQQGRDVRRDKHLLVAEPDDERGAPAPECDQGVRSVAGDAGDGIGALKISRGTEDRPGKPVGLVALDQVDDDFRVGLRAEAMPVGHQRLSKLPIVLDDPVVDDGDLGLAIEVRMSIGIRRPAMGGPSCVADAECSLRWVSGEQGLEISDLAGRLPDVERHPRDRGNPGGVIAAVLQPTKTRKDEGDSVPMADVADDSTHRRAVLTRPLAWCNPDGRRYCAEGDSPRPREGPSWDSPGL